MSPIQVLGNGSPLQTNHAQCTHLTFLDYDAHTVENNYIVHYCE